MHHELSEVLERRLARDATQPVAEIAGHALLAARGGIDPARALHWSRQAAAEATRLLAHAEAADHLDRALEAAELGELDAPADRLALRMEIAVARTAAGDFDEARRRWGEAADAARRLGEAESLATASLGFAEFADYAVVDRPAIALLEESRAALPAGDSAQLAQVLGRLAVRLDPLTEQGRREALLDEGIAMARRLAEPRALARLLALSPLVHWRPESAERRAADAAETIGLATEAGDPEAALWALMVRHADRFATGDVAGAEAELADFDRRAAALRQRFYHWYGRMLHASHAAFDGRLETARRLTEHAGAENREREPGADEEWAVQRLLLARVTGRPGDVPLEGLRSFAERYARLPVWQALLATAEWTAGDPDAAGALLAAILRRGPEALPPERDRVCTLALLADLCAGLGEVRHAESLIRALEPFAERNVLTDRGWAAWGAGARPLGRLAAAAGQAGRAAAYFDRAIALHRAWGARPWLVHALRDAASSVPGERDAGPLREEAGAVARAIGL